MDRCLYPKCGKKVTVYCTCHLDLGPWCDEHIDNHYVAMKYSKRKYRCCAEHG